MNARCARLYNCSACGLVSQRIDAGVLDDHDDIACPRCGNALHQRIPDSLQRTWACLAAALLLYAPDRRAHV